MNLGYNVHSNVNNATIIQHNSGIYWIPTVCAITPAKYGMAAPPQPPTATATPTPLTCSLLGNTCNATILAFGNNGPINVPQQKTTKNNTTKYKTELELINPTSTNKVYEDRVKKAYALLALYSFSKNLSVTNPRHNLPTVKPVQNDAAMYDIATLLLDLVSNK